MSEQIVLPPPEQRPAIPEEGMKRLRDIQAKYPKQLTVEGLVEETYVKFYSPNMQKDKSFASVNAKLIFCSKAVKNKYNTREPLPEFQVLVWGKEKESNFDGNRKNAAHIFFEEKDEMSHEPKMIHRRIDFEGKECDILANLTTPAIYDKVPLIRYKNGNFKADDRVHFGEPSLVTDEMVLQLLRQDNNVVEVPIANAANCFPTIIETATAKFADKNDVYIIHAMVGQVSEKGSYTVNDESVEDDQIIDIKGEKFIIKTGFRIWCNPEFAKLQKDQMGYFVGTFGASKGSKAKPKEQPFEITMNACYVTPEPMSFGAN